jgi:Raf kinase inhibitor-like YbhB/YbcL family protein
MRAITSLFLGLFITSAANAAEFSLTSSSFSNNDKIPVLHSCDGKNISPQLSWSNAPSNTQSFVLIFSSPDWPIGAVYLWVLYNIPADIKELPEKANTNLPQDILVGNNFYSETSYRGPCPPDSIMRHYVFTIYALDSMLSLSDGAEVDELFSKMQKHILKKTELTGTFSH